MDFDGKENQHDKNKEGLWVSKITSGGECNWYEIDVCTKVQWG